jgi:hypothetical protein
MGQAGSSSGEAAGGCSGRMPRHSGSTRYWQAPATCGRPHQQSPPHHKHRPCQQLQHPRMQLSRSKEVRPRRQYRKAPPPSGSSLAEPSPVMHRLHRLLRSMPSTQAMSGQASASSSERSRSRMPCRGLGREGGPGQGISGGGRRGEGGGAVKDSSPLLTAPGR